MKYPFDRPRIFIAMLAWALAQFACSFGVQPASISPQPTLPNPPQPTQPPAAGTSSEHSTQEEAKALLQLAIEHYNAVGRDQALADFTAGQAPFRDRDLYVGCIDSNHIVIANGGFPYLVGSTVDGLITTDGRPLGAVTLDIASAAAVNSVDYQWINPVSGETEPKTFFFQKIGADICGVGVYHP